MLKNVIKLTLILLTALSLTSCRKYEVEYHYTVDLTHAKCFKLKLLDSEKLVYGPHEEVPFTECDGMFGVHYKDTAYTLSYLREEIKDAIMVVKAWMQEK